MRRWKEEVEGGGVGGQIADFLEKWLQVHLIIIREWPKNTSPHFKKSP